MEPYIVFDYVRKIKRSRNRGNRHAGRLCDVSDAGALPAGFGSCPFGGHNSSPAVLRVRRILLSLAESPSAGKERIRAQFGPYLSPDSQVKVSSCLDKLINVQLFEPKSQTGTWRRNRHLLYLTSA